MAVLIGEYSNSNQTTYGVEYVDFVDISNCVDSTTSTYTSCEIPIWDGVDFENTFSEDLLTYTNNIDTTRSDYIVSVEIGYKYYTVADELHFNEEYQINDKFIVIIGYNNDTSQNSGYLEIPLNDNETTYWIDITNKGTFPGTFFWNWSDIDSLSQQIYIMSIDSTSTFSIYIDQIYLRITTSDTQPARYGLRCYDGDGNVTITETDALNRLLYSTIAEYNEEGEYTVTVDQYTTIVAFAQSLEEGKINHRLYKSGVSSSGTTISETWAWTPISILPTIEEVRSKSLITIMGY
jgi:hypothetical protein